MLGDIQLSLIDRRGNLELEVIRARGLQTKAGSKLLPAPWVKVKLNICLNLWQYLIILNSFAQLGALCVMAPLFDIIWFYE